MTCLFCFLGHNYRQSPLFLTFPTQKAIITANIWIFSPMTNEVYHPFGMTFVIVYVKNITYTLGDAVDKIPLLYFGYAWQLPLNTVLGGQNTMGRRLC